MKICSGKIFYIPMVYILQNISLYFSQKMNRIRVWNDMRVSEQYQYFHFQLSNSFTS